MRERNGTRWYRAGAGTAAPASLMLDADRSDWGFAVSQRGELRPIHAPSNPHPRTPSQANDPPSSAGHLTAAGRWREPTVRVTGGRARFGLGFHPKRRRIDGVVERSSDMAE